MPLPDWAWKYLLATAFVHTVQFVFFGSALVGTGSNIFTVIKDAATFNATGLPDWFTVVMFLILTLPGLLIVAAYVFQLFGSEIGAAVAILLGLVTGAIAVFA